MSCNCVPFFPRPRQYTGQLLPVLQSQKLELAYVTVSANTRDAYWTPYKGHPAEGDFVAFKNNRYVLFGNEAPAMYQLK